MIFTQVRFINIWVQWEKLLQGEIETYQLLAGLTFQASPVVLWRFLSRSVALGRWVAFFPDP